MFLLLFTFSGSSSSKVEFKDHLRGLHHEPLKRLPEANLTVGTVCTDFVEPLRPLKNISRAKSDWSNILKFFFRQRGRFE